MIHAGFFENRDLALLGPAHQVLFAGLWTIADRVGLVEDLPKRIDAIIFPYSDNQIDKMLNKLSDIGLIKRLKTETVGVIYICKFMEYQKIHPHESPSKLIEHLKSDQRLTLGLTLSDQGSKSTSDSKVGKRQEVRAKRKEVDQEIAKTVPCAEIIEDLNLVTNRTGRQKFTLTDSYKSNIILRWLELKDMSDDDRMESFKYVHRVKQAEWAGTPMAKHLNPGTLYRPSKFSKYLLQRPESNTGTVTDKQKREIEACRQASKS